MQHEGLHARGEFASPDPAAVQYYSARFQAEFQRRRAMAFQDLVATILEKRFPGDFRRIGLWGRDGDWKMDGFRKSTRSVFQIYGPEKLDPSDTIRKIEKDFWGALAKWQEHYGEQFGEWVFVHNSAEGLPPRVQPVLRRLERESGVTVTTWSYAELHRCVLELDEGQLADLFGPVPTRDARNSQTSSVERARRTWQAGNRQRWWSIFGLLFGLPIIFGITLITLWANGSHHNIFRFAYLPRLSWIPMGPLTTNELMATAALFSCGPAALLYWATYQAGQWWAQRFSDDELFARQMRLGFFLLAAVGWFVFMIYLTTSLPLTTILTLGRG